MSSDNENDADLNYGIDDDADAAFGGDDSCAGKHMFAWKYAY